VAAVWPGLVVPVFLGGEIVYPGIALTYSDMQTLATNLTAVINALGTENAMVEPDTGDEGLSGSVGDFTVHWVGKRLDLTNQLTSLQGFINTIVAAMKQADDGLANVPSDRPGPNPNDANQTYEGHTIPKTPRPAPPALPGWPATPGTTPTSGSPYPWKGQ